MKIKDVSKMCGLSIDTIRYYERIGLIKVQKNGYFKNYDSATVNTLIAIKKLRFVGLSITEIRQLNNLNKEVNKLNANDIEMISKIVDRAVSNVETKLREITEAIQMLEKMKKAFSVVRKGFCFVYFSKCL